MYVVIPVVVGVGGVVLLRVVAVVCCVAERGPVTASFLPQSTKLYPRMWCCWPARRRKAVSPWCVSLGPCQKHSLH
ncbi:hypothetical protein E2C01_060140 [Portunus trituberculatus]|uniref:Uncharacterized protein n=1 Tax=Portunus trituberculatus TaxID=210409 RepID=A0A5B7H9M8_PORTR|nr:hypothetical protein [Portunus trituberculatus]